MKVNSQLMSFTAFGGTCKSCRKSRSRKIKKRSRTRSVRRNRRNRTKKTRRNRTRKRRRSSKKMRGGFIRAGSPVFNWGNKCANTGVPFKLEN